MYIQNDDDDVKSTARKRKVNRREDEKLVITMRLQIKHQEFFTWIYTMLQDDDEIRDDEIQKRRNDN